MRPIKIIGITGGIGSGKSTVARIFESIGFAVYYADPRAKALMTENPRIVSGVTDLFGPKAYLEDGSLNRAMIGEIVFSDKEKLSQLNAVVHPEVGRDFMEWVVSLQSHYQKPFALKEAAILYESGSYKATQGVISVYAPKTLRLERVVKRDGADQEAILARMDKQWADLEKIRRADFVVYNDGTHSLISQVLDAISYFS